MLITDEEILSHIRNNYRGHSAYNFSNSSLHEEKEFIVVKDIHAINEDVLNISKDIFVRDLQASRQINCINISNLCDSLNAESCDLGEEVYKELEKYNKIYTKAFLRNGSRWIDVKAFNLACDKAKGVIGNNNPRVLFNISKYSHILNSTLLKTTNLRLSLVKLQSLLELMHTEIRKVNYDLILRPVTTLHKGNEIETVIQTKYFNNFFLHGDITFDHDHQVFGTISGLAARKKRGEFGVIKPYYYQFKLDTLLKKEYGYLNLNVEILGGIDNPILVNQKQIAHKVLLRRKKISCSFSPFSKFTAKVLLNYQLPKEAYIYDYNNPVELNSLPISEVDDLVRSKEAIQVYQIDETLYDSYSVYDTVNPQSNVVVEKGEFFNANHTLFGIVYSEKIQSNSIVDYANHFLILSKTLKSDQIQRVKLFDSMIHQQRNAITRAEQAEKAVQELKKNNEYIIELNASLQDKVAERTKELKLANEQLTNTFINLTHETKTPIMLITYNLEEHISKHGLTEELKIAKSNMEKLNQDIINFFDLERMRKGLNIYDNNKITEFSKLLKDHILLFKPYAGKKKIDITGSIDDALFVKADPESLYRIVNNLIENAIKFTEANGRIEISLKCIHDTINFSVKDSGIGIPLNLHDKIFEPYYQINAKKKNFQGMGMGLSIVKQIIDSLKGKIIVISDPLKGSGTEITIQLPVHRIASGEIISEFESNNTYNFEPEQLNVKEQEYDESKRTIMIVEDNIQLLNYMAGKLTEKYNIQYALSGNEALEKLKTIKQLDIIVSDVMMDDGDGFDFYNGISTQKKFKHIPFIFLTAKTNGEDKKRGLSSGAMDYIYKPFDIHELTYKIDAILNKFSDQRETLFHHVHKTLLHQNAASTFEDNCIKYKLTTREKEIIQLIAKGQTHKEIASTLHISVTTVAKHIQNMFEKVGADNKTELVNKLGISPSP